MYIEREGWAPAGIRWFRCPVLLFAAMLTFCSNGVRGAEGTGSALRNSGLRESQERAPKKSSQSLEELLQELETTKVSMDFLDLKVQNTRSSVRKLEAKIAQARNRMEALQAEIDLTASESLEIANQMAETKSRSEENRRSREAILTRFRGRLVHLHKIRQGTLLTSIFSAKDLNGFLNRFQLVRYLLQHDRDVLQELGKIDEKLLADSRELENKEARLAELAEIAAKSREEVRITSSSLSAMLQTVILERKVLLARQEKLKKSREDLEKEIAGIESSRQQDPKEFEGILADEGSPPSHQGGAEDIASQTPVVGGDSRFIWPVRDFRKGKIISSTGSAPPTIEIPIAGETDILACAKGKVLFKGPMGQFGNLIILAHKNGFSTVYANLDEMLVGLNEVVPKGEVIGRIIGGKSDRLHFEVRFGGKNQDPLTFLPKAD